MSVENRVSFYENARVFGEKYYKEAVRLAGILAIAGACQVATPEPTPTQEPTPTKPAPTATWTPEATATATATSTPEPTATNTPEPTATATNTPEPSPTPEFQFEPYGVYIGEIEGVGGVLFLSLPNGAFVFQEPKIEGFCGDGSTIYNYFVMGGKQKGADFSISYSPKKTLEGELIDAFTIKGTLSNEEFSSGDGKIKCPASVMSFEAKLVGSGKNVLLEEHRRIVPYLPDDVRVRNFENACGCELPEG